MIFREGDYVLLQCQCHRNRLAVVAWVYDGMYTVKLADYQGWNYDAEEFDIEFSDALEPAYPLVQILGDDEFRDRR